MDLGPGLQKNVMQEIRCFKALRKKHSEDETMSKNTHSLCSLGFLFTSCNEEGRVQSSVYVVSVYTIHTL